MRISKMCLEQLFSHYKWAFTDDFVPDFPFKVTFRQFIIWHRFSPGLYQILQCFLGYRIGNLMKILKMALKQLFSHSKWVLQTILSLTALSNCVSSSCYFDTAVLPDCIKSYSVFLGCW